MRYSTNLLPSRYSSTCLALAWLLLALATTHVSTLPATAADSKGTRTLLAQAQPAVPSPTPQPSLLILPINRAKFLAGTRFDFRVEANHLPAQPTAWEVTVAGQTPEAFFGTQGQVTNTSDHSQEQTFRDVTIAEPGAYKVSAKVVAGETTLTSTVEYEVVLAKPLAQQAKNVMLFIGDGMSLPFRTAARIVSRGLSEGKYRSMLEMDDMDHYAVVTTSGMESIATDSANSGAAYATGHKSVVNAMGVYPDNTKDPNDDPRVETIVELVKRTRHMAVGLVTTTEIQDATPAAMFAHTRRRSEYLAIMDQYLNPAQSADVIMGGGSASLLPQSTAGSRRKDNRDLFKEFETKGYEVVTTRTELRATSAPDKLLGLFHLGNMNVYLDKAVFKKADVLKQFTDQPMLWEMTEKALDILGKHADGFFLMVEGGLIDKQAHPLDWPRAVWDTIELDKAVGVAKKWAMAHGDNTLIIVVADHAHSMSITGTYWEGDGKKGREAVRVYGEAKFPDYHDADGDGFPEKVDVSRSLAIHWANHPDYYENYKVLDEPLSPTVKEGEKWVANKQRAGDGELQTGNLPASESNEVHTVEDVPLTASGPGAEQFHKAMDNTEVFFAIVNALGLDARQGISPFVATR
jgi:alkaline phosphatase